MPRSNTDKHYYTDKQMATLYDSLSREKRNKTLKKILKLVNKHDIPLTNRDEAADILVNLLPLNRVATDLNDIKIVSSKNVSWLGRIGKATTAISDGKIGERGQLDDELSEYANITGTPIASRKSIKKRYKAYLRNSNAKGHTKKKKPKKRKKRQSIRKK
tara:strand:- start:796 stop:1275 length:480 start_codon:yes stop_codon:yes gene_type:complete